LKGKVTDLGNAHHDFAGLRATTLPRAPATSSLSTGLCIEQASLSSDILAI